MATTTSLYPGVRVRSGRDWPSGSAAPRFSSGLSQAVGEVQQVAGENKLVLVKFPGHDGDYRMFWYSAGRNHEVHLYLAEVGALMLLLV